jgi:hypothetical protein
VKPLTLSPADQKRQKKPERDAGRSAREHVATGNVPSDFADIDRRSS